MNDHREMFDFVRNRLKKQATNQTGNKALIHYDRYDHTVRVYKWMLRIALELNDDNLDFESLKIATIFHDVGYGLDDKEHPHAPISAEICKDYLEGINYPPEKIEFICDIIERHSMKRLLYDRSTPLELIVLMEADLLDDTGAQGIVMDVWIQAINEKTSFDEIMRHIEKYTVRHMKQTNFVTAPAKKIWHEKRRLVYDFIRQYKRDLGDMR